MNNSSRNETPPPAAGPAATRQPPTDAGSMPTGLSALLGEPAVRPWFRRPGPWTAIALLLLPFVGGLWWWAGRAAAAAPGYLTQPAVIGDMTFSVTVNGTLQPTRSIAIGSELSGTVLRVNVDVNDRVRKGQVLVVLDTALLGNQVRRSTAALAAASSQVTQTAATATEAGAALARLEEVSRLSGGLVPSAAEIDAGRAALERALAAQAGARAGVLDAQAALATDRANLGKASIVAPADGVVLTRSVDPGNAVAASLQAVTLFTVAEDLAKLRLWVYVDEADVGAVQVGQPASFTVSAHVGRDYPARITRVGFGSTITDNVVTYLTYLDVDNADLSLRPGMTATATIVAQQRHGVLLVPNAALRYEPASPAADAATKKGIGPSLLPRMPGGNTRRAAAAGASTAAARQVWVLPEGAKGTPIAVAVTPGISDGRMTEITGGALRPGMQVITGQQAATP